MTKKNNELRNKLKKIEAVALQALNGQPEDSDACELQLLKALAKIGDMSGDYRGLVEVRITDIDWDTDGKKVKGLPRAFRMMIEDDGDETFDNVVDALSDKFEFCIKSCNIRRL